MLNSVTKEAQVSDAGSDWISRFLHGGVHGGRRCVVIGGVEEFFQFLLDCGWVVAHLDQDQSELDATRSALADEMGALPETFTQHCINVENDADFSWRADDTLILIRSLHHLSRPGAFLNRMRTVLPEGSILIVDWTVELFERQLGGKESELQYLRASYAHRPDALAQLEREWEALDAIDARCMELVRSFGWNVQEDIAALFQAAELDETGIMYALPCPCTDYTCRKTTTYWFGVWPATEQYKQALNSIVLQRMIFRSAFD